MTEPEPLLLGTRKCWHCHRVTPILWDARMNRAYCPHCLWTQPERRHPNTQLQRLAWTRLRTIYKEGEGVSIDQQRGTRGVDKRVG